MALRLSSSAATATGTMYLNRVMDDTALSMDQKTTSFKYLSIILKNLLDPVKSQDMKYRTLKLDNAKLGAGLFSIPAMMELLTSVIGFVQDVDSNTMSLPLVEQKSSNNNLQYQDLLNYMTTLQQQRAATVSNNKRATPTTMGGLSEKQKARRLLEEKQQQEKLAAKEQRKRNLAMLKQDKLVRETDENWKPGVSAACAKSGSGISTFRDRHGEQ